MLASTLAVFGVSTVNAEVSTLDGSEVIVSSNQSQDAIIQEVAEEEEIISPLVTRYQGYSRENVAESIADAHFSDAKKVIIVNRDKFSDAISATNISQGRYPVLYTHSHKISESTIELLKTMSLDQIYILGGTLSIQDSVVSELTKEMGVKVTRLAGRSRYDANASAVSANYDKKEHVVIASGEDFKYQAGQHAVEQMPDQDGNEETIDLMIFDNNRVFTRGDEELSTEFSRAVQYRINEVNQTVEEIWSYGEERGTDFYSDIVSDADYLSESETVLINSGRVQDENSDEVYSMIVEVTKTEEPDVVYEVHYGPFGVDGMSGYVQMYRAERLSLYP